MHVIIVLGAQNDAHGRLSPMAVSRARGALDVYRRWPGTKLLVTGGYGHFNPAPQPHAHYLAAYLVAQGIGQDDILSQVVSAHTVEDAAMTRQFLYGPIETRHPDAPSTERGDVSFTGIGVSWPAYSIVVVTSEVHVSRARLIFEHFYDPMELTFVGTPDAVSLECLRELEAHEVKQIARIHQQGGVIYQGRLWRHMAPSPTLVEE